MANTFKGGNMLLKEMFRINQMSRFWQDYSSPICITFPNFPIMQDCVAENMR